jgi:glyoxylase-like metal-dependent hydrolase (beta-lactamase superfamily II)
MALELGGRTLELIHTPGHARHHHCIWDPRTRGWFTGDSFGLSYREFDAEGKAWAFPTTTPVQFEPEAMRATISRLLEKSPACMYLTHYGKRVDPARIGGKLLALLDEVVALGHTLREHSGRHAALRLGLKTIYAESLHRHGCELDPGRIDELLEMDIELNAQGMACWLDRDSPSVAY